MDPGRRKAMREGCVVAGIVVGGALATLSPGPYAATEGAALPGAFRLDHVGVLSLAGETAASLGVYGRHKVVPALPAAVYDGLGRVVTLWSKNRVCDYSYYNNTGVITGQNCRKFVQPKPYYESTGLGVVGIAGTLARTGRSSYRIDGIDMTVTSSELSEGVEYHGETGSGPDVQLRRGRRGVGAEFVRLRATGRLAEGTTLRFEAEWPVRVDGRLLDIPVPSLPIVLVSETDSESRHSGIAGPMVSGLLEGKPEKSDVAWTVTPAPDCGRLEFDATWRDSDSGDVTFTAPESLAGSTASIRRTGNGGFRVSGPGKEGVRITVASNGSGSFDIGYGGIRFDPGAMIME